MIGIAVLWALFVRSTGSVTGATILLVLLGASIIGLVVALRYLGINSGHPWARYLAGRPWRDGRDVLQLGLRHLPEEPTVSRVHAEFTFTDGRWHITNRGRNGVTLNGTPLAGEHVIRDGDSIGWGTHPGALASRVEIGWDKPLPAHGQR